ncbi:MAG: S53 family peptidase, partial [Sciscionella sp.]|nr:S53 family peptidase [Sciscionella sp.]
LLPVDIANVVQGVVGLDNHALKHNYSAVNRTQRPRVGGHATSSALQGYTPDQLQTAYDTKRLGDDGSGLSVAFVEFDGYQFNDIAGYDQEFGLAGSTPTTISVDGADYDNNPGDGQLEVSLDIETVHAIVPKANDLVYEAPNSDQGEIDMAAKIASDDKASVVSISWGSCEQDTTQTALTGTDNAIKQGVAEGISYFAASGDDGSSDCARSATGPGVNAVDFPASDPNVTGVGGTSLSTGTDGTYSNEVAWSGSGGGVSTLFDQPSYQQPWVTSSKRAVPDVASDADPNTGYAIYSAGQWQEVGGTSAATPMWASLGVLANGYYQSSQGNMDTQLYAGYGGAGWHDINGGSNGSYTAGQGYDAVTGLGSYDAGNLLLGQ